MFDALSDKLQRVFGRLSSHGTVSEKDLDEALREVRVALLEADVNFRVVKDLVARIKERAVGVEVLESLTPAQMVISIVNEELCAVLGEDESRINYASRPPSVILMVGLQGSGKTTTCAKLATLVRRQGRRPSSRPPSVGPREAASASLLPPNRRLRRRHRRTCSNRPRPAMDGRSAA